MSFHDLPQEWSALPLTDTTLAVDVVDLFLKDSDRRQNSALLLICDDEGHALQPVVIGDIDWYMTADERVGLFRLFEHLAVPGVVVAVSAGRPIEPEVADRWLQTARAELAKHHVQLFGFYSADLREVWEHRPAA
ncbi:hypothetical protein [Tessaracoccus sp. ZS01]|uniref:hypothetical protein n=1 Tax=Tessaracoccus sp. ZS01 TaxID=1906324 RepID=UPI00096D6AE6|nr:hypothetical protein [Tessaracoccus sp. ZS01]MCG6566856.1 hypothetical protein [Tessaracoccus sp. ZS01]OMG57993.1 hypothetical protein BJN44_04330 [Tessaracoccus sp. ZS01]